MNEIKKVETSASKLPASLEQVMALVETNSEELEVVMESKAIRQLMKLKKFERTMLEALDLSQGRELMTDMF